MSEPEFEYGPVLRGLYIASIAAMPLVAVLAPARFTAYVALVIFLGLGLRPLLERAGIYQAWQILLHRFTQARERKRQARRDFEITLQERDKLYRHSHARQRDARLPKNW